MTSGPKLDDSVTNVAPPTAGSPSWWQSPAILPTIFIVITGAIIARESMVALALTVIDGGAAAGVLLAAALAGGWLVRLLGLGNGPLRDRLVVGAGLGVGLLSSIVLGLGSAGLLTRPVAFGLVGVLAVLGLLRVLADFWALLRNSNKSAVARRQVLALTLMHYLWLLACPFLALTAMAAANPPGVLWAEEAGGYDILEYHLAVPKEFFEAGHIFFMPYNVYSNFPLNSEMISLLMMTLRGNAIDATFMAQMANVVLGILFVAAAWWTGRMYSRSAGIVAGVLAAISPWIVYLAGIAFVEPGMLAMGMLSLGAMLRAVHANKLDIRWLVTAGLLAGMSAGYKYTAIPLIVVPIAILPLFWNNVRPPSRRPDVAGASAGSSVDHTGGQAASGTGKQPGSGTAWPRRLRYVVVFALASLITFSPWMLRNVVNTRNPVFPLAYKVFGARASTWDDTLDARWCKAHGLAGSGLGENESRITAAWQRTVGDPRFGLIIVGLAGVGAITRRDRWTAALLVMLAVQFGIWLFATHLFARFAVVLLLPMVPMAARLLEPARSRSVCVLIALSLMAGAGVNLYDIKELYYHHTRVYGHTNLFVKGKVQSFEALQTVNELEGTPRVLMVGEARTYYVLPPHEYAVVFNHHPLAEAVRRCTGTAPAEPDAKAVLAWMRRRGITHMLVNWMEMVRLQKTYGLDEGLDASLFKRLEAGGLAKMDDWSLEEGEPYYATLYEVPNE